MDDVKTNSSRFVDVCSNPLMLAMAILMSITVVHDFWNGNIFNVFEILISISAWLCYGMAKSGKSPITGLKMASGTVKAVFIVLNVTGICLLAAGLIGTVTVAITGVSLEETLNTLKNAGIEISVPEVENAVNEALKHIGLSFDALASIFLIVSFIALTVAGMIIIVINFTFVRPAHNFTKSCCDSEESGEYNVVSAKSTSVWLMIIGIILGLCIFMTKHSVAVMETAGACILTSIWINTCFIADSKK